MHLVCWRAHTPFIHTLKKLQFQPNVHLLGLHNVQLAHVAPLMSQSEPVTLER